MKNRLLYLAVPVLLLAGCASVPLPKEALREVDPGATLADVKANPERYMGYTLLLGGQIVENKGGETGSSLEILNYNLNSYGRPVNADEAGGRFIVRANRFLDPEVYEKGDYLTLTATVAGQETRQLQGVAYTYPVFRMGEAHLWRETPAAYGYPGYYYPYYGPNYYHSPYDPFWSYPSPWYRDPWYYDRWGYRPWRW